MPQPEWKQLLDVYGVVEHPIKGATLFEDAHGIVVRYQGDAGYRVVTNEQEVSGLLSEVLGSRWTTGWSVPTSVVDPLKY